MESHPVFLFFLFFLCQNFTKRYSKISWNYTRKKKSKISPISLSKKKNTGPSSLSCWDLPSTVVSSMYKCGLPVADQCFVFPKIVR
jgi:hypothetical protein